MNVIIEEVDGNFYMDVVLSPEEIKRIKRSENIDAQAIFKRRKWYVGARMQGYWDEEEITDCREE